MNKERHLTRKQKKLIYILSIGFFILLMFWISTIVGKPLIEYASNPDRFVQWLNSYGIWSRLIFMLIVVLQVVIAIIPGGPFQIAAGYAFGIVEGTLLTTLAVTIGCWICFILVRSFSKDFIEVFFSEEDIEKLSFLKDTDKLRKFAFVLNLVPGVPKDLLSYFAGLTSISLPSWLVAVFSGRIPAIIVSCLSGRLINKGDFVMTAVTFVFFGLCGIIGLKLYDVFTRKQNQKTE
ncbi:MAG: TVP38/TMEM64 family protein [Erysipelotrichaceae bacterium]|nr:TVP38/TMEM64 family protein [Erysipelotrichaceae bacterium]